jgi:sugar phosphate isomerase/epimerase
MTTARDEHDADLLASFWTLAGDLDVRDPAPSPWPFEQRVAAAAEAGFSGIGIDHRDIAHYRQGPGLERMRAVIDSAGISIVELELITGWLPGGPGSTDPRTTQVHDDLFAAAEVLRARHVKAGAGFADSAADTTAITDAFAALCRRAEGAGSSLMLELLAVGPLSMLPRAAEVIKGAGSGAGLLLDAWHVQRAGVPLSAIAALADGIVGYVELCDGPRTATEPAFVDATRNRRPCGEGEFDLPGFVDAVRRAGYRGPFGVEILSAALRSRPLAEIAHRSAAGARSLLAQQ